MHVKTAQKTTAAMTASNLNQMTEIQPSLRIVDAIQIKILNINVMVVWVYGWFLK